MRGLINNLNKQTMNLQEEFKIQNEGINPEIEYEKDLGTFKDLYVKWLEEKIKQLMLADVVGQSEQLVCDVCGSTDFIEAPHMGRNCNRCHPL